MNKVEWVYRCAAEIVHNSTYRINLSGWYVHRPACLALMEVCDEYMVGDRSSRMMFAHMFKPEGITNGALWFGPSVVTPKRENLERSNHRIFALLFMAELAKDQGL